MSYKSMRSIQNLLPIVLIVLVSALTFLPFAGHLGFYRDDWYMLWSANVRGADSLIELFSIDRPIMGYTYSLTYRLLGNTPFTWQLYAFSLKTLGAIAVYGIVRMIWPVNKQSATAAGLLFLVYPGFLGQPNAATMTNQLLSLTVELFSIWFSGLAVLNGHKGTRPLWITAAVLSGLLNLLLYEYMIGLEVLRLCVLWLVIQQTSPLDTNGKIRYLIRNWWPYGAIIIGFLVWRLGFFQSAREGTDQVSIIQSIVENPRSALVYIGLESIMDTLETVVLAWAVPFERYATAVKPRTLATALFMGMVVSVIVLVVMKLEIRMREAHEAATGRGHAIMLFLVGIVSLYGAFFPVLAAGRDVDFTSGFDRYTLHASPSVAILLSGFIYNYLKGHARQTLLIIFLFLGISSSILNANHWQSFWENELAVWWQLWWRAPGLNDSTILLTSIPDEGFFEDYEIWGPANLIYRPGVETVTIGAEVLNMNTFVKVRTGAVEKRGMRGLGYQRDYKQSLLLALPSDNSCLKVVDGEDILLPLRFDPRLVPILRFSYTEQIDLFTSSPPPSTDIFGPEPEHNWCFYFQSAERAKQEGDWETVVQLGEEVLDANLKPVDRVEWLPFLEGFLLTGDEDKSGDVALEIIADPTLVKEICDALIIRQYRFGEPIQQRLTQILCER